MQQNNTGSLNKIAYDDDQQVVELSVLKRWTEDEERIEFLLEEIGGNYEKDSRQVKRI